MNSINTQLEASIIDAGTIEVSYSTLPGNRPHENGNWIGLWQGSVIPRNQDPISRLDIANDESSGQVILTNLQLLRKPYILGYAANASLNSISASVQFTPGETPEGSPGVPFSTTLSLAAYNSNSLVVDYSTIPGNIPDENFNWIGLWAGDMANFSSVNRITKAPVQQRSNDSSQALNDIVLAYQSTYTIAYCTGKGDASLATSLTFQTGEALS